MKKIKKIKVPGNILVGLEKFKLYAKPRNIFLVESSYGLYVIKHNGNNTTREACRASMVGEDGPVLGWVINLAGRQRKFISDERKYGVYPIKK